MKKRGNQIGHRYAVIMAGGNGTRLWPMSHKDRPKQFQSILSEKSLLVTMYELLRKSFKPEKIFIQVPKAYVPFVKEQILNIRDAQILIEPEARDTGPAFVFAAATLFALDPKAVVGFYYSDHLVQSESAFHTAVAEGFETAEYFPEHLVLIGVHPLYPHTGLGYIKIGKKVRVPRMKGHALEVRSFVEKPSPRVAKQFVSAGGYLWNTGYKVGRASHILSLLTRSSSVYREQVPRLVQAMSKKRKEAIKSIFKKLPRLSFEYTVTEKTDRLLAISSDMLWSDVGDWGVIDSALQKGHHNTVHTMGRVAEHGSKNTLIVSHHRSVVGVGLENIIVVETKEGVLVMSKKRIGDMKKALEKLRSQSSK